MVTGRPRWAPPCPSSGMATSPGSWRRCRSGAWRTCWPTTSPRMRRCCCGAGGTPARCVPTGPSLTRWRCWQCTGLAGSTWAACSAATAASAGGRTLRRSSGARSWCGWRWRVRRSVHCPLPFPGTQPGLPELCTLSPGLPSPFAGPDKEDCPERPAEGCSLQQLLPEDRGSWKRRTRGEDPAGAKHCPGSLAGGQGRRGGHPCSPAARALQQASRCAEGSFHPRRPRQKRKSSIVITSESARSPQPCEAPGAGAVPAAAERRLDPGSLWQVGEG